MVTKLKIESRTNIDYNGEWNYAAMADEVKELFCWTDEEAKRDWDQYVLTRVFEDDSKWNVDLERAVRAAPVRKIVLDLEHGVVTITKVCDNEEVED